MKAQIKILKYLSVIFLLFASGNAFSQINPDEMNGIQLDFTIQQTKKKIGHKLNLEKTKDGFGGYNLQTSIVYNGVTYQLIFSSLEDENDLETYNLTQIITHSENAKTDVGIRIGSTVEEVQNAYKIYEYKSQYIYVEQGPETPDPEDTTVEYYQIYDSEGGHLLRFSFTDNKVSEIEIASVDSL